MIMKKLILFLIFGFLLLDGCEKSVLINFNDIEAEIIKEMQTDQIPSVVACVVKGDKIVWEGNYGYQDAAKSKGATSQTIYTLMSISKLFIAISVMQLWEEGLIDLDADINQYLPFEVRNPNFPDKKITPYMLLTHRSGLAWPESTDGIPGFYDFFPHEDVPLISEWLPEYILPDGEQYKTKVWKNFAPGEMELYSNIATSLMALIVEQISGMDYRDYCRENILIPLEMNSSAFRLEPLNEDFLATPFYNNNYPMQQYTYRHYPAANLKTNLEDFSHFMIAFLNDGMYKGTRILKTNSIKKMMEVQNPGTGMALIWSNSAGSSIGHIGGGTGFSTLVEWHFDGDKGFFIFSNKYNGSVYQLGRIYELVRYQSTGY
jgi:CubicO group peptidase (beta-lactamase class C family)